MLSKSISLERRIFRLSELLPVAVRLQLASGSLKRTVISFAQFFAGLNHFSPQNPIFDPPNIPIRFQKLFTGPYTQKGFQKHIKHEIKYRFNIIHQIKPFL